MLQGIDILLENDDFIVLNKPSGLLSIPDRFGKEISLKVLLAEHFGRIFTVHRLDKETSGVIIFAKNETAHQQFSVLFESRNVKKYYVGLLHGLGLPNSGTIEAPITAHPSLNGTMVIHPKGKEAKTDFEVLERFQQSMYVRFQIHTGRTHQIRLHAKYLGHTLLCDALYGDGTPQFVSALKRKYNLSKKETAEKPLLARLALHAQQLIFTFNSTPYAIEAPLQKDFKALLQQLRKWKNL